MNKKIYLLTTIALFGLTVCSAQELEQTASIKGKPILTVFADYKAGLKNANDISGFNLNRAFVGYEALLPKGLSAKVILNVETYTTENGKTKFGTYLKNAQINWQKNTFSIALGLINLYQFSVQENIWGHRYIAKSFQEEYEFAYCEDIGIAANYEFSHNLSVDIALTNGEGRKFKNEDNKYRYGAGITWKPTKNLLLRGYGDIYNHKTRVEIEHPLKDQYSLALFMGYTHRLFSIGAEFNKSYNHQFLPNMNLTGYSVYSTILLHKSWQWYGRFDLLKSSHDVGKQQEENATIVGIDYKPMSYIRLSPNFQSIKTKGQVRKNYLLVSIEFKI